MIDSEIEQTIKIDALEVLKVCERTFNLRITNLRQYFIRVWLATELMRLAAMIGGFGIEITEIENDNSPGIVKRV